ncbi:MAG: acyl-CoA/acyl-ACP dehydrogenase [Armatimonadetes bacterium]|nr:acyl-CoA/acyl-ACP dehydrogenase [Armatimonadota bacterium]
MPLPLKDAVQAAEEAVRRVIGPQAARVDRERRFPEESFWALGEAGLMGLMVPVGYGGLGADLSTLARVCETIAAGCASTAMCYLMHCCGTAVIAAKASPEQGERFLRPIAKGEKLSTLAFSERGTGAHFYQPEIQAHFQDGHAVVSGRKGFVTNGERTDYPIILVAASDPAKGLDVFVLDSRLPGVRFEDTWEGLGMAGNNSIAMVLDQVRVPRENLLGEEGDGLGIIFNVVAPTFMLGLSGVNLGIAEAAFQAALQHARDRKYSDGSSLADHQAIQFYLTEMHGRVESLRLFLYRAGQAADSGEADAPLRVMQSKVMAAETSAHVTQTALQVCGGQGYTRSLPVERYLRDARASSVMAPTTEILKTWIGKSLAGIPLF